MNSIGFKSLDNTSLEDLAQEAFNAFNKNKTLILTINRGRASLLKNSRYDAPLMIDKSLREKLNLSVIQPLHNSKFYFKNLKGELCFIDEKVQDRFVEITKNAFPNLVYSRKRIGIIDTKTNVELMNDKVALEGFCSFDKDIMEEVKIGTTKWRYKLSTEEKTPSNQMELYKN